MNDKNRAIARLAEWQFKSPLKSLRLALHLSQEQFSEKIGLTNRQTLQRWESGYVISGGQLREYFVPTKWLRAMLRAGIDVDFKALHDWFESRPKVTL
jgi:transcriptional regulator with XRE-family HTH domain